MKRILFVIISLAVFPLSLTAMKRTTKKLTPPEYQTTFSDLPNDMQLLTLQCSIDPARHPAQQFSHYNKLREVCTLWKELMPRPEQRATMLGIPHMHFLALTNQSLKFVADKNDGQSPFAFDKNGCSPLCYAYESNAQNMIKLLETIYARDFLSTEHIQSHKHFKFLQKPQPKIDKKSRYLIDMLHKSRNKEFGSFIKTLNCLFPHGKKMTAEEISIARFALKSRMEATLFAHLETKTLGSVNQILPHPNKSTNKM